ncbi:MAG TPA: ACT domain-containing protein [Terriglobales bacterium]|nr:ACT domain-containing protein [Terriglobales bacterium]
MARKLKFSIVPGLFAVSRLLPEAAIPQWAHSASFASITRTSDEVSIVCLASSVPEDVKSERDWACLKLLGPFPFQETGILASFLDPCARTGIPIFAISTFDTDYVLIKQQDQARTIVALTGVGYELV